MKPGGWKPKLRMDLIALLIAPPKAAVQNNMSHSTMWRSDTRTAEYSPRGAYVSPRATGRDH
jgi:hypothetical protein